MLTHVCLCLQMRLPTTSFADKNSVQRLAADVLPNQPHVTAFNVQVRCCLASACMLPRAAVAQRQRHASCITVGSMPLAVCRGFSKSHLFLRWATNSFSKLLQVVAGPAVPAAVAVLILLRQQQQQPCCMKGSTPPRCVCVAAALQFSQQQGNRCRSVLSFVAKESVDLLIIGLYKNNSRRKGLALKGNALALASRSGGWGGGPEGSGLTCNDRQEAGC